MSAMNEKKRKILNNLECFKISLISDQYAAFETELDRLNDSDFERIDKNCMRIVRALRYANPRANIDYKDGLEVLVKLGLFISLSDNKNGDKHG